MIFAWLLLSIFILIIFVFSLMLVKYYVDPAESYLLATLTIALSITVSSLCVLIIPIDIYVSSALTISGLDISSAMVRNMILGLYCASLVLSFFFIPYTYFYGEERNEDFLDIESTLEKKINKIANALKYTLSFIFFTAVLLIVGLVFRPGYERGTEKGKEAEWIKQIFDLDHVGESAIYFCIAVLTCIGIVIWIIYGAYGLAKLPMNLIRGSKSLQETKTELSNDLSKIRERYRSIQEKYARSHTKISKSDQRALTNLKKQEKLISDRNEKITLLEENFGGLQQIFKFLTPFRVMIGMVCLSFSILILSSLALTTIDKCGISCGFLIEKQSFLNPIDFFLVYASHYFPMDYVIFFLLMFYVFIACLYGIIKSGIKILCFTVYEIRKESTMPQALLIMCFLMNLMTLVLSNQLLTLSPQYTTFGSQRFLMDGKLEQCSLQSVDSAKTSCKMSNTSSFLNKVSVSIPFFGVIFFLGNALFQLLNFLYLFYSAFSEKKNDFDSILNGDIEENSSLMDY